ncbi:MAG: hypothetical protein LBD14_04445, partial [Puniceicoccales bacterium]|nr:hypothetical protein [Puniceicoccales bacterium]
MNATKFSLTAKSPRFPKRALFAAASMAVGVAGSGPVHAATEGDFWKSEQRTISINFGNSAITKGSAGAVDVAYTGWNNVGTASMSSLIDNTGATAGSLSLTLKDTDVYNTNGPNQSAATTGNGQLLYKFIDTWNIPADGMFAVNNLGGFFVGSYDVYLYVATSDGAITTTARYHPFLINGTMYKGTNGGTTTTTNEADEWTPLRGSDSQALVEGNGGSYLKVTGLTDATLDVRSVRNDQSNGVNVVVGDVAGVQISGHVHVNADFRYWKGGTGAWGAAGTDWATVTGGAGSVAWGTGAGQVAV